MEAEEEVFPGEELDGATAPKVVCSIPVDHSNSTPASPSSSTPPSPSSTIYPADFDVHKRDSDNNTELHLAARLGDEAAVRELVRMGADIDAKNNMEQSPLNRAALRARETCRHSGGTTTCLNVIDFLAEQGADLKSRDVYGNIFLHLLLGPRIFVNPMQLHQVAEKYGELFSVGNNWGLTSLHYALWTVKVEMSTLSLLHDKGVNFGVVDKDGYTVLVYAVIGTQQSVEVLSKVIEFGADYKRLTNAGWSLLHWVAVEGDVEALAYLVQKGGLDINGQTIDNHYNQRTPLHFVPGGSSNKRRLEIARLLLDNGADKTIKERWGKTPFDLVNEMEEFTDKEKVLELLRV